MFWAIHWSNPKNTYFGPICFWLFIGAILRIHILVQYVLGQYVLGSICFGLNMFWAQYVFVKYVFANMFLANMFWVICFSTAPNEDNKMILRTDDQGLNILDPQM